MIKVKAVAFLCSVKNDFSKLLRKICAGVIILTLLLQQIGFAQLLPQPVAIQSSALEMFRPVHLRYLSHDAARDTYRLLVDPGSVAPARDIETQTAVLMRYFLIGLALPNSAFWVNLRPDAPERVIDADLARTDIGKIMLEADVQLKKDLAAYTSPRTGPGRRYWDKLYEKAGELFGPADCSIPTMTRPWIVPGEIILRAGEDRESVFIYKATLKVMLESDYLKDSTGRAFADERLQVLNDYSAQLIRREILPRLTRDVNTARRYAALRQVYYSLILAQWFKQTRRIPESFAIDSKELTGLCSKEPWEHAVYYERYRSSFQQGEYNLRETVPTGQGIAVRQYFSGGVRLGHLSLYAAQTRAGVVPGVAQVVRGNRSLDPYSSGLKNAVPVQAAARRQGAEVVLSVKVAPSAGESPDGGEEKAENARLMERLKTLIVPQVTDTRVAARLKGVGKQAQYLPTIRITRDFLPAHYSTSNGLRPVQALRDFPRSLKDIPRVEVIPLKIDDSYVVPFSEVNNGSQAVVLLGQLEDSLAPIVLKTYPGDERLCLSDYQGAQLAEDLGIGPRVHGIYDDSSGRSWIVVDLVPGDFPESGKQRFTAETIAEYKEIYRRFGENYLFPFYDFQYFVTPEGHIWVIDPMALVIEGDEQGLSEQEWLMQYSQEYKKGLGVLAQSVQPEEKTGASSREGSSTVKDNLPSDAPALYAGRVAVPGVFRTAQEKGFYGNILDGYATGRIVDSRGSFVDDHSVLDEGLFEENTRGLAPASLAIVADQFARRPGGVRILITGGGSGREAGQIKKLAAQQRRLAGIDRVDSISLSPVPPNYWLLADARQIREDIRDYLMNYDGAFPGLEEYYSLLTGKPAISFQDMSRQHFINQIQQWPEKPVPVSAVFGLEQQGHRLYHFAALPHTDRQFIVQLEDAHKLIAADQVDYTVILDQCGGFYYMCKHDGLEAAVRAVAPLLAGDGIFYAEQLPDDMDFFPESIDLTDLNVRIFVNAAVPSRLVMVRGDSPYLDPASGWFALSRQLTDGIYAVDSIDRFLETAIFTDGGAAVKTPVGGAPLSREIILRDIAAARAAGAIFMPDSNLFDAFSYLKYGLDETNTRRFAAAAVPLLESILKKNIFRDTRMLVLGPGAGLECSHIYDLAAALQRRIKIDTVSLTPLARYYRLLKNANEIRNMLVEHLSTRGASLPGLEAYYEQITGRTIRDPGEISREEYLQLIRSNPYHRLPLDMVFSLQNTMPAIYERLPFPFIDKQLIVSLDTVEPYATYDIIYDDYGGFYYTVIRMGLEKAVRAVAPLLGKEGVLYVEHLPFLRFDPSDLNGIDDYIFLRIGGGARLMIMRKDSRIGARTVQLLNPEQKVADAVYEIDRFDAFLSQLIDQDGGKPEEIKEELRSYTQVRFFNDNVFDPGADTFDRKVEFVLNTIPVDFSAEYKQFVGETYPELAREQLLKMNLVREIIREYLENAWDAIRSYDELDHIAAAEADIDARELAMLQPRLDELKRTAVIRPAGYPGGKIGIDFRLETEDGREVLKVRITDNGAGERAASSERKRQFNHFYKGGKRRGLRLSNLALSQLGIPDPYQRERTGDTTVVTLTLPLDMLDQSAPDGGLPAPGGIDLRSLHTLVPGKAPSMILLRPFCAGPLVRQQTLSERQRWFAYLAQRCRIEEDMGLETSPELKRLLVLAEAS